MIYLYLIIGLITLISGGELLVSGAIKIAKAKKSSMHRGCGAVLPDRRKRTKFA